MSTKSRPHDPSTDAEDPRVGVPELREALLKANRRIAELELNDSRFRRVFDHSNDAVFIIDPVNDEIIDVNAKACSMLGFKREELLSMPISGIHPHELPKLKLFAQTVLQEKKGFTDELSCMTKNGELLRAEISASVVEMEGRPCLISMVRDISERERLTLEKEYLAGAIQEGRNPGSIICRSPALKKILQQVDMVAPTDASVMITGESGTGKELVAAAIHDKSSRRDRPMVTVNCASIPAELFESEFFGHVKGSFTGALRNRVGRFELSHKSTLFLDEIGEIPLNLQGKLLRVLQEGQFEKVGEDRTRKVDVRILAATNRDLPGEAKAARFRQDLFYRLSVFPINIPPLRERKEDIGPMASYFIQLSCNRLGLPCPGLTQENIATLENYPWPGNARELQNVVERAMILGGGRGLQFEALLLGDPGSPAETEEDSRALSGDRLTLSDLERLEREVIVAALERSAWKIYGDHGAAARLGLKPTTLRSRMKKMEIQRPSPPE